MYLSIPIQALISKVRLVPAQILLNHQQKMYTYGFLNFFDNYLAKKILLISFQNGNADTIQVEDQPEDILI